MIFPKADDTVAWPLTGEYPAHWPRYDRETPEPDGPDVGSASEWDEWWSWRLGSGAHEHRHDYEFVRPLLPFLRSRSGASVLSAGCGIALDVRALAAAGMRVTGLDRSRVALDHARSCEHFDAGEFLAHYELRDGGAADWVEGDLLDPACCPGPYDAIICRNLLQYFWRRGRLEEALLALSARMKPSSVLVVGAHGDIPSFTAVPVAALKCGYALDWRTNLYFGAAIPPPGPGTRLYVQCTSTG